MRCWSLAAFFAAGALQAQTAISVTDTTGWNPWVSPSGTMIQDLQADQQTGQTTDDFVGDATYAGFQQKAGTIGGTDSVLFRARFDTFAGADKWGNGGNFGIGMDLNGDGAVDLITMYAEGSGNVNGRSRTVTFGTPGWQGEHYGFAPGTVPEHPGTLDYLVASVGGCLIGTFGGALKARGIDSAGDKLTADALGEVVVDPDGVLRLRSIHVRYTLSAPEDKRAAAERACAHHAAHCPNARSVAARWKLPAVCICPAERSAVLQRAMASRCASTSFFSLPSGKSGRNMP